MTGEDKKPFWDRYDIHVKRWQTTLALIVALGAVIAFGVKFPWNEYWPFKDDSPPRTSSGEITTEVRSLSPTWAASIEIDKGIDPIIEVQIEFDNVTGQNADDVVVNLVAPRQLHAIPDGVQLIDAAHSQGFSLGD
jgi:hypothetical protein